MNEPNQAPENGAEQAPEAPAEGLAEELAGLEASEEPSPEHELERLKAQISALKDEVLRERAEAENVRKRAARDVESAHKYGLERLVSELIPVKDSMDMGLDAAQSATDLSALVEGMALTAKMFDDCFDKLNIKSVDPSGERFDADYHQAMMTEPSAELEPGTVVRVMQKGYLLNERLVRPALVVVAKAEGDA